MPEPQRKSFLRRGGEIFANLILEEETPTAGKSASAAKSAGARTAVMVVPIGKESGFTGVVDLVPQK